MSELDQTKVNNPEEPAEQFTLEQILSEYKSEAFMRNERKLSKDKLEVQAERIVAEMRRELEGLPPEEEEASADAEEAPPEQAGPKDEDIREEPRIQEPEAADAQPAIEPEELVEVFSLRSEPEPLPEPEADEAAAEAEAARLAEEAARIAAMEAEAAQRREEEERRRRELAREREEERRRREEEREERRRRRLEEREENRKRREEAKAAREEAERQAKQEWLRRMADLGPAEAGEKYATGIPGMQRRTVLAFAFCVLSGLVTLLGGKGSGLPAFLQSQGAVCTALLALQAAVMLCCWDVLVSGIGTLAAGKPGCETLVTFANLAALGDALWLIRSSDDSIGLPYSTAAALSLAFALLGTRMGRTALRDSFRTMRGAKVPTVVQVEPAQTDLGPVITKHLGGYRGFIARMLQQDPVEELYRKLSLLLIAVCVGLSLLTSVISGSGAWLHSMAGLGVAAASCTALLAYHRPFMLIARRLAGRGAAIAGWSGAEEIRAGEGMVLRDGDLFPEKTVSITGMKVLSGTRVEQIISYTGSMILTSGSGLAHAFSELMRQYAAPARRTDDFQYDAEGGFCANISQDRVFVGTGAYMSLKGIQIPANVDVNGAIYTAVNGKLCALFIVEHTPSDSVRAALLSLSGSSLRPVFAIRDFNITPAMLMSKFRLTGSELSFPPAGDRFRLSADGDPEESEPPAAILTRESLNHYLEVIRSGRRMVRAVRRSVAMTLIGTAICMGIIALSAARGAFVSISAWNLIVFQLGWTAATLLISDNADGDR